jgi:Rod binding domain-containing protein
MSAIPPVSSSSSNSYEDRIQNVSLGGTVPKFSNLSQTDQAREAARQFEAILVRQLLNESIGKTLMGGSGAQSNVYGYMMTDMFAEKLTQGPGIGLGQMLAREFTQRDTAAPDTPSASQP